jgi:hypothetical protein
MRERETGAPRHPFQRSITARDEPPGQGTRSPDYGPGLAGDKLDDGGRPAPLAAGAETRDKERQIESLMSDVPAPGS